MAPARLRGRLATAQQMSIVLGIFAALVSNAFLVRAAGGAEAELALGLPAWRWMFLVAVVPSVAYVVAAVLLPESPRYLVMRGDRDGAARTLRRLHRVPEGDALLGVATIEGTLHEAQPAWSHLFSGPGRLKPIVWLGIALAALQALVGIDVIFYYSTSLWAQVGFGEQQAFWLSALTSLVNVAATVVAIFLVDRVGRRRLLLVGSVGMTVALAVMATGFAQAQQTADGVAFVDAWGVVTLVAANVFVVAFAVSWGPVVWILVGGIFPDLLHARAGVARRRRELGGGHHRRPSRSPRSGTCRSPAATPSTRCSRQRRSCSCSARCPGDSEPPARGDAGGHRVGWTPITLGVLK